MPQDRGIEFDGSRAPEASVNRRIQIVVWSLALVLACGLVAQLLISADTTKPNRLPRGLAGPVPPLPPEPIWPETRPSTAQESPETAHTPRAIDDEPPAKGQLPGPSAARPAPGARPESDRTVRSPSTTRAAAPKAVPSPASKPPMPKALATAPKTAPGLILLATLPPAKPLAAFQRSIRGRGVVFVVDQSSSMVTLMPAVKRELGHALSQLTPAHRFNVMFFADQMRYFETRLVRGTRKNTLRAWDWVKQRKASGNTRALQAFRTATHFEGAKTVVMLTDGALLDSEYRHIFSYVQARILRPEAARTTPCLMLVPLNPGIGRDVKLARLLTLIRRQPELAGD